MFGFNNRNKELTREVELVKSETKRLAIIIDFLNLSTSGGYPRYKKYKGSEVIPNSNFDLEMALMDDSAPTTTTTTTTTTNEEFGNKLDNLNKMGANILDKLTKIEQRVNGMDNFMEIFSRLSSQLPRSEGRSPQT